MSDNLKKAIIGGGCFWCTEAIFQNLKGVYHVVSGYAGGHVKNPSYREVCNKTTGHAEVIEITYDPAIISYQELLQIHWQTHDPTTPNQQGNDKGPQYRSIVMYQSEQEKSIAQATSAGFAQTLWDRPIVTEIVPTTDFYPAEEEHQDFYKRNGSFHGYCTYVISPKVVKARQKFAHLWKESPQVQ